MIQITALRMSKVVVPTGLGFDPDDDGFRSRRVPGVSNPADAVFRSLVRWFRSHRGVSIPGDAVSIPPSRGFDPWGVDP